MQKEKKRENFQNKIPTLNDGLQPSSSMWICIVLSALFSMNISKFILDSVWETRLYICSAVLRIEGHDDMMNWIAVAVLLEGLFLLSLPAYPYTYTYDTSNEIREKSSRGEREQTKHGNSIKVFNRFLIHLNITISLCFRFYWTFKISALFHPHSEHLWVHFTTRSHIPQFPNILKSLRLDLDREQTSQRSQWAKESVPRESKNDTNKVVRWREPYWNHPEPFIDCLCFLFITQLLYLVIIKSEL